MTTATLEHVAVRDCPRQTIRAHPVIFKKIEKYRRAQGMRSLNEAMVDLIEKALEAAKV